MFSVSTVKPIPPAKVGFRIQKHLYSRHSYADLKFWWVKSDFRAKINVFTRNFRSQFSSHDSSSNMKHHSVRILKSWSQQLEFLVADRIRRSLQLISLYNKWWGNPMNNLFLRRLSSELLKRRTFYFTTCLAPVFDWNVKRINEKELNELESELDYAKKLFSEASFVGSNPNEKDTIDDVENLNANENSTHSEFVPLERDCKCIRCQHLTHDGWMRLYTSPKLKIWRKEHINHPGEGLYVYKVYGRFDDVTADDFFRVQIDVDYRKTWDSNSVVLNIIESDTESNSDVLYWEFLFPKMFYNRDYVCNRRFSADPEKNLFVIVCESIDHPNCPEKPPIHRVKEYWSHTVIRSMVDRPSDPGVEFTITYYDNPEVSLPHYITLWYSITGMPEYMENQRKAALRLADYRTYSEKEKKNRKEIQQPPEKRVLLL